MKYIFLIVLFWTFGFLLPVLGAVLQLLAAFFFVLMVVAAVMYYIETRINTIRL